MKKLIFSLVAGSLLIACQDDQPVPAVVTPAVLGDYVVEAMPATKLLLNGTDLQHTAKVLLHDEELAIFSRSSGQLSVQVPATAASGVLTLYFNDSETTIDRFLKVRDDAFTVQELNYSAIGKIDFVNELQGFLYANGAVYKTGNGGISWQKVYENLLLYPSNPFSALNPELIWLAKSSDMELALSRDGGSSWQEIDALSAEFAVQEIIPLTAEKVVVAAKNEVDGKGYLFLSTDGGNRWDEVYSTENTTFSKSRAVYAAGNTLHLVDARNGLLIRSEDGGRNWTEAPLGVHLSPLGSPVVAFADAATGWAFQVARIGGPEPGLYKTTDGGASWQLLHVPQLSTYAETIVGLQFSTAQEGVAVTSHGGFMTTQDGGQSWTLRYLPNASESFADFSPEAAYFYTGELIQKSF